MNPRVTIVIPFYCDPYVPYAIQSALDQTYFNVEVLVVSDGSHSHNELLLPYMNKIRFMEKQNGGTASALNHGISYATGEYIAWLSSDDVFYPHKLATQLDFMIRNRARISFTNFDVINEKHDIISHSICPLFSSVVDFYRSFLVSNPVNGCTVVAEKQLLLELGLFDESLPYTHDYDLWIRVLLNRIDFYYLNESLIKYRYHDDMGTVKHWPVIEKEIEFVRSKYRTALEHTIEAISQGL